jgi:hypothetical protein
MKPRLVCLALSSLIAAPALAWSAPADLHSGIYQFRVPAPGECALRQRERAPVVRGQRPQRLGDLPRAYVIRLVNPGPVTVAGSQRVALGAPGIAACEVIERVK